MYTRTYIRTVMPLNRQSNTPTQTVFDVQNMKSACLFFFPFYHLLHFSSHSFCQCQTTNVLTTSKPFLKHKHNYRHSNTVLEICIFIRCFISSLCTIFPPLTTHYRTRSTPLIVYLFPRGNRYTNTHISANTEIFLCICVCVC